MVWRTTIITTTTCFLLGTTFTHWIADHNVLWRSPLTPEALLQSIRYYSLLGSGPPGLGWFYIAIGLLALTSACGKLVSGWRGRGGEVLFDGGSVVLLAGITYNQALEVFPTITSFPSTLPMTVAEHPVDPELASAVRDLANDNVITAVMLTGVMLLQAGRYYSSRGSGEAFPRSTETSLTSSPTHEPANLYERAATPFRELTEDEALELGAVDLSSTSAVEGSAQELKPRRR